MHVQNIFYAFYYADLVRIMSKSNLTPIEQYVVDKVREMRIARGLTVRDLANELEVSFGFIGDVESTKRRAKYKLEHLNKLAEVFECSPRDFLPKQRL